LRTDDKDIVNVVRKNVESRNKVIEELYTDKDLKSSIATFIIKNGGNRNQINDVFTYAILTFIKQCYRPLFSLDKNVNAYIFSIAKYHWFKIVKEQKLIVSEEKRPELSDGMNAEKLILKKEKNLLLKMAMKKLDQKCRDVLTMWANNLKMREIALQMSYKSEGMARKKKHECVKKLRTLITDI